MASNWKTIWENKQIISAESGKEEFERFCELKKANGFDVAVEEEGLYLKSFYKTWLKFYEQLSDIICDDLESVYEVGCGSGVNLFMLKNRLPEVKLGGCDYSSSMVESAKIATLSDAFSCCSASEIQEEPQFDLVMAESVFQYFESQSYAENVLRKMIKKSRKITYLGEIHDKEKEKELMDYRRRTIENYDERYKGLNKLFLSKQWIQKIASEYGKQVLFTSVDNPEYINGKYEFNCYIYN